MTIVYFLLIFLIILLWATMDNVLKAMKKIQERLEDIEDILVEVKANTEKEQEQEDLI